VRHLRQKEHVDLVLCLSHAGTSPDRAHSEDEELARAVPGIDIIISGHTHRTLSSPIIEGQGVIVSASRYGAYLGSLVMEINPGMRPRLLQYQLIPVTDSIPDRPSISRLIATYRRLIDDHYLAPYGMTYNHVIAECPYDPETLDQDYARRGETGLGNLIADAFRYAISKAEGNKYQHVHLTIVPQGTIRSSFLRGNIAASDVFRVLSLGMGPDGRPGYPIITAYLTGREIKRLLEVDTTIAPQKRDAQLQVSGVRCTYNPHRLPFDRVMTLALEEPDGSYRAADPDRLYRVAMSYYCAQWWIISVGCHTVSWS